MVQTSPGAFYELYQNEHERNEKTIWRRAYVRLHELEKGRKVEKSCVSETLEDINTAIVDDDVWEDIIAENETGIKVHSTQFKQKTRKLSASSLTKGKAINLEKSAAILTKYKKANGKGSGDLLKNCLSLSQNSVKIERRSRNRSKSENRLGVKNKAKTGSIDYVSDYASRQRAFSQQRIDLLLSCDNTISRPERGVKDYSAANCIECPALISDQIKQSDIPTKAIAKQTNKCFVSDSDSEDNEVQLSIQIKERNINKEVAQIDKSEKETNSCAKQYP